MLMPLKRLQFPIQYLEICHKLVGFHHGDTSKLYKICGVSPDRVSDPLAMIDGEQLLAANRYALTFCKTDIPPALQILQHFPLTTHGSLGLLALSSQTLGDALKEALFFLPFFMPAFKVTYEEHQTAVSLQLEQTCDFGNLNDFFCETVPLAAFTIAAFLTQPLDQIHLYLKHQSRFDPAIYEQKTGVITHFGASKFAVTIPKRHLSIPILTQSPVLNEQLRINLLAYTQAVPHVLVTQLKSVIYSLIDNNKVFDSTAISDAMNMSYRTLSRRLAEENLNLSKIQRDVSMEYAKNLLLSSTKTIHEVATKVGFNEIGNFSRAFKQSTGQTPSQFRVTQRLNH